MRPVSPHGRPAPSARPDDVTIVDPPRNRASWSTLDHLRMSPHSLFVGAGCVAFGLVALALLVTRPDPARMAATLPSLAPPVPPPAVSAPSPSVAPSPEQAATLLLSGHREAAAQAYAQLAQARPGTPVFAVIARILARPGVTP